MYNIKYNLCNTEVSFSDKENSGIHQITYLMKFGKCCTLVKQKKTSTVYRTTSLLKICQQRNFAKKHTINSNYTFKRVKHIK